jgi:DNA repair photolyase
LVFPGLTRTNIERTFYTLAYVARAQYLEDTCKTALNKVPETSRVPFRWTINPYRGCTHSCHYCFARAFHAYLDLGIGDDFSSKIVVKTNVADVLRRELASPRWTRETVAMGTATDPYQHCEGRYKLTRGVVGALADFANPLSILTKSTLIVRDLDVYRRLAEVAPLTVSMSVGTLDENVRRVVEPGTPPGRRRLEILSRFAEAGIRTGVLVAPILPGLTDDEEHLDEVLEACAQAGVAYASPIVLHVRSSIREHFMPWLRQAYPWLYPRYVELYGGRAYAPKAYQEAVGERFARLRLRHGIGATGGGRPLAAKRDEQLALAV